MRSESRYGKRNNHHSNKKDMSTNEPTDDSIDKQTLKKIDFLSKR